jgi:hypothetical protein
MSRSRAQELCAFRAGTAVVNVVATALGEQREKACITGRSLKRYDRTRSQGWGPPAESWRRDAVGG